LVELDQLKKYLDEALANKHIGTSKSPAGSAIFFVKEKDETLRPVVDYRHLNAITIKNRYPLPLIDNLLDQLTGARYFSKMDLQSAYNLVRMDSQSQDLTAFRTRFGHFEY
jgi:Reverse transcriptase (RNA-dependent DNA polymerase)